jgi:hypothetical protein
VLPRLLLGLLLALYAGLLLNSAANTGVTLDEPSHLLSARLYWSGADTLKPRDMPPLIKIVAGWPARFFFPLPDLPREDRHEWTLSLTMIRRTPPEQIGPLMFASRAPLLLFPLGTALLIFLWSRALFSEWTAVCLAALWMIEPTALGHASLFKNDHAAAFGYLATGFTLWRYWTQPSTARVIWLAVGVLLAILSKLSLFFVIPIAVALVAVRSRRILPVAVLLGVVYAGSIAACQFELTYAAGLPLPKPLWDGLRSVAGYSQGSNSVWLNGRIYPEGHRAYFLLALLWKSPIALLMALIAGFGWILWRQRSVPAAWFLLAPAVAYVALASLTSLQFGIRLILPALPFALLALGYLFEAHRVIAPLTIAAVALSVFPAYPNTVSYFNEFSRTPLRRLHRLSDSNIDWGHGLPGLKRYVDEEKITFFRLVYFGNDVATRYFGLNDFKNVDLPWDDTATRGLTRFVPRPGLYAVSPSALTGQYFKPKYRDYFHCFRSRPPDAVLAGGAMWIYIVDFTNPTPLPPASGAP